MTRIAELIATPTVIATRAAKGVDTNVGPDAGVQAEFQQVEKDFLESRDSVYLASTSENGWPYVQHRGGAPGFIKVLSATSFGWVERTGNRQYLTSGNITASGRLALIAVDYPQRARLKVLGTATYHAKPDDELIRQLGGENLRVDGAFVVELQSYDWNCPKYITPRFTEDQVRSIINPLQARIDELEAQLAGDTTT